MLPEFEVDGDAQRTIFGVGDIIFAALRVRGTNIPGGGGRGGIRGLFGFGRLGLR
jgi:hypothetical protein